MLLMLILAFPALATLKLMGLHKNRNTKKWGTTGSIYKSVQSSPEGGSMLSIRPQHLCALFLDNIVQFPIIKEKAEVGFRTNRAINYHSIQQIRKCRIRVACHCIYCWKIKVQYRFFLYNLFNIKNYRGSPWIWIKVLHPKLYFYTTRGMRKYLLHHQNCLTYYYRITFSQEIKDKRIINFESQIRPLRLLLFYGERNSEVEKLTSPKLNSQLPIRVRLKFKLSESQLSDVPSMSWQVLVSVDLYYFKCSFAYIFYF